MRSDDVIADRYRLVEVLGAGGMGIVWLADDLRVHRQVALKRPLNAGAGVRADLDREAEVAKRIAHPGAVKVLGVAGDGDDCWLVMEYFPATNLVAKGILPPREVAAIGAQVAGALATAHEADVVHRDVAPGNVLVADNGTAKVTDFGISAWRAATITGSGKVSGTAAYVVTRGRGRWQGLAGLRHVLPRCDAVRRRGGRTAVRAGDPDACLRRIRAGREEIAVRAGALKPVLDALLQRDAAARPTAAQAKDMLDRVASGLTVPAWPGVKRRPKALLAGAAAFAVVVVLLFAVLRPWESEAGGPARTVLGDPRGADPCAVADARVLGRFGEASVDADYGGFNRCDVLIEVAGDDEIDVRFQFEAAGTDETSGPSRLVRHAPERESDSCDIALTLADRSVLAVTAKSDDDVDTDFCQVADVAADHAESLLGQYQEIPRRPALDPRSLVNADACRLLGAGDLTAMPAYTGATVAPGFGSWSCRWDSPDATLRVIFDRNDLESAREGTRLTLSGREVYVVENGYGESTCAARVFHLRYQDPGGDPHVELALVVAEGGVGMTELCRVVSTLAAPVAARLPKL